MFTWIPVGLNAFELNTIPVQLNSFWQKQNYSGKLEIKYSLDFFFNAIISCLETNSVKTFILNIIKSTENRFK